MKYEKFEVYFFTYLLGIYMVGMYFTLLDMASSNALDFKLWERLLTIICIGVLTIVFTPLIYRIQSLYNQHYKCLYGKPRGD